MAQTLLLGLGGTGSRIVNYVASDLKKKNVKVNDGNICCAVLDTNENDQKKVKETGVGIPVIPTSKDRVILDYLKMYAHKGVRAWMPESPGLLKESMKDGAAQMRTKSRLAFLDIIEDKSIHELEEFIDRLFDKRDDSKIRVMIVSSLAGGTGSGMFIQAALWLRKYFSKRRCSITIRGIFVLPDVFINTVKDIREDETESASLYANAYGAIRELNAITKIKTKDHASSLLPVKIDNLFDSEVNQPDGTPVYDYAFFIDDISEGGSVLKEIDQYEQVAARLVYMQMYAPMHDDLYSVEDNLFKRFQRSKEPVFGACGTAKAIYPTDDILRYCALRASQDSISTGWRRIDDDIANKIEKEEERESNGAVLKTRTNARSEYIRLFEVYSSKSADKAGSDKLFINIANDIKNEKIVAAGKGETKIQFSDKIGDFVNKVEKYIADTVDTKNPGGLEEFLLGDDWLTATGETVDTLKDTVSTCHDGALRILEEVDNTTDDMAEEIVETICAVSMGDVNMNDDVSVYGMLVKKDGNEQNYFVHPIAVRYLLYKLQEKLDSIKRSVSEADLRASAENGYDTEEDRIEFDNKKTKNVEEDAMAYLDSLKKRQEKEKVFKEFKGLYAQFNAQQKELCRTYAIGKLKRTVAIKLSERLQKLVEQVEAFFKDLIKVSNTLSDSVGENVRKNTGTTQKITYICATEKEKEALYKSLSFDTGANDTEINKIIVESLYGKFCAENRPKIDENKAYANMSVATTFFTKVVAAYEKLIMKKNKEDIDLDIYTAVCKSADIAAAEEEAKLAESVPESDRLNIDVETGEVVDNDERYNRHISAMKQLVKELTKMSAPFLISDDEQPEDSRENVYSEEEYGEYETATFMPIKKRMAFWGFNPVVADKCPELGGILGINVASQQNAAYAKNELDCYRTVYGIQAGYIPKFNELNNGDYYTCYRNAVNEMAKGVAGNEESALIHTPHLDKTWHLFLPYITPEKQRQEDEKFYRLFWLALAYGVITLNNNGKYQMQRTRETTTGKYYESVAIKYEGKDIGKVDVHHLITALRLDGSFMMEAARCEKEFKRECEELDSYESTRVLRGKTTLDDKDVKKTEGGLASDKDNNAMTIIVRYNNSPRHSTDITAMLIQSLEKLLEKLVENKYERNEEDKIRQKSFELCKRIYDASTMKDKDIDLIRHWKEAWSNNK